MTEDKKKISEKEMEKETAYGEYLAAHVIEKVETKLAARMQQNWYILRLIAIVAVVIMLPAAWFAIKAIASQTVSTEFLETRKEVEKYHAKSNKRFIELKTFVEDHLLYMELSNEATIINLRPSASLTEIKNLMQNLEQISKISNIKEEASLPFLVNNVASLLIKFGYENFLPQVGQLFPDTIRKSKEINKTFIAFYGRKVLNVINVHDILDSSCYKEFQSHVHVAELHNAEQDSLPFQVLVQFHLADNLRSLKVTKLLYSIDKLQIRGKAMFLWTLIGNTNPRFWQKHPTPADYRISKTTNQFVVAYHNELSNLSQVSGVKESLLDFYENANTVEDRKLGKYIIDYFYKIPLD